MVFRAVSYYVSRRGPRQSGGGDVYDIFDERHKNKLFKFNLRENSSGCAFDARQEIALNARRSCRGVESLAESWEISLGSVSCRRRRESYCFIINLNRKIFFFRFSSAGDNTAAISRRNTSTASHSSTLFRCLFYPSVFITFLTCR